MSDIEHWERQCIDACCQAGQFTRRHRLRMAAAVRHVQQHMSHIAIIVIDMGIVMRRAHVPGMRGNAIGMCQRAMQLAQCRSQRLHHQAQREQHQQHARAQAGAARAGVG